MTEIGLFNLRKLSPAEFCIEFDRISQCGDVLRIALVERRQVPSITVPYARAWRSCRAGEGFADSRE